MLVQQCDHICFIVYEHVICIDRTFEWLLPLTRHTLWLFWETIRIHKVWFHHGGINFMCVLYWLCVHHSAPTCSQLHNYSWLCFQLCTLCVDEIFSSQLPNLLLSIRNSWGRGDVRASAEVTAGGVWAVYGGAWLALPSLSPLSLCPLINKVYDPLQGPVVCPLPCSQSSCARCVLYASGANLQTLSILFGGDGMSGGDGVCVKGGGGTGVMVGIYRIGSWWMCAWGWRLCVRLTNANLSCVGELAVQDQLQWPCVVVHDHCSLMKGDHTLYLTLSQVWQGVRQRSSVGPSRIIVMELCNSSCCMQMIPRVCNNH